MNHIINVVDYLQGLGNSCPTGTWAELKTKEPAFSLLTFRDQSGKEYIPENSISYLKSVYEKLYSQQPTYLYVIDGKGFNSSNELKGYLTSMLRKYKAGQSLEGSDRSFFADLLSRSPLIVNDITKQGYVVDLKVNTKPKFTGNYFEVTYASGRQQVISIINYTQPKADKLINIWQVNKPITVADINF